MMLLKSRWLHTKLLPYAIVFLLHLSYPQQEPPALPSTVWSSADRFDVTLDTSSTTHSLCKRISLPLKQGTYWHSKIECSDWKTASTYAQSNQWVNYEQLCRQMAEKLMFTRTTGNQQMQELTVSIWWPGMAWLVIILYLTKTWNFFYSAIPFVDYFPDHKDLVLLSEGWEEKKKSGSKSPQGFEKNAKAVLTLTAGTF